MHSLQKQFHDFVSINGLIDPSDKVLVAVSGGVDSMVLADLLLKEGFTISVAHCNYSLRGKESDEDAEFVRQWAKTNEVPCHTKRVELGEVSVQLAARNARYEWFSELVKDFEYQKIATAHHLDDSLETVLYNLSRGTGIRGMTGVAIKKDNLIRPLLFASKKGIYQYAEESGIDWREDSSNATQAYDRNFIRQKVIPRLSELNPSLIETYKDTKERLAHVSEIIESRVEEVRSKFGEKIGSRYKLDLSWISERSDLSILSEILSKYGFNYTTCKDIFDVRDKAGKQFLSEKWRLTIDRDRLYIEESEGGEMTSLSIQSEGKYQFEDSSIELTKLDRSKVHIEDDPSVALLDADQIQFPLTVRSWKEGDRFKPLGMDHSKKVSDFLIDEKVPLALKNDIKVLVSGNDIIWIIGHRISNDFKIREGTQNVLKAVLT